MGCLGNKVRFHREQSAGSLCLNRFPRDYCTPNRCAAACACASAKPGSPTARTRSCSSSPADIPWPTFRRPMFLQTASKPPNTPRGTPIWDSRPGDLAGHGGEQRAVFVYQIGSYRYWQEQLKRADFVPGQFSENFTIEGLPDDAVCIGDRYRIGSALFEVTQPRVTAIESAFG